MARKKSKAKGAGFMVFNVIYEDGTISSNRRVPNEGLNQSFGDDLVDLARTAIQEQDNEISRRSNQLRGKIKSIVLVKHLKAPARIRSRQPKVPDANYPI